jgi:hypothetical protein
LPRETRGTWTLNAASYGLWTAAHPWCMFYSCVLARTQPCRFISVILKNAATLSSN